MSKIHILRSKKADDIFRLFVDDDQRKRYYLERIAQSVDKIGVNKWTKFIELIYDDVMSADVPLLSGSIYAMWYKYLQENPNNDMVIEDD